MASHRRPTRFWRACLAALAASTPLSAVGAPKASALGGCSAWESDGQGGFATGLALSTDPIRGDDQDNIIEGTPGNDFILALGGDDVVHGNGGDDVICGGDGDDTLFGDDGRDSIYGEAGNDIIRGGSGDDNLYGGPGSDGLCGGEGDDTAYLSPGDFHDCEHQRPDLSGTAREASPTATPPLHLLFNTCRD